MEFVSSQLVEYVSLDWYQYSSINSSDLIMRLKFNICYVKRTIRFFYASRKSLIKKKSRKRKAVFWFNSWSFDFRFFKIRSFFSNLSWHYYLVYFSQRNEPFRIFSLACEKSAKSRFFCSLNWGSIIIKNWYKQKKRSFTKGIILLGT